MFLPVKIRGRLLVDGMLAHAVPTVPLREMGAKKVLAVHLQGTWTNGDVGPRHLFDVIGQCFAIAQEMNCDVWKAAADLVIDPDVNGFKYDDFGRCNRTNLRRGNRDPSRAAGNPQVAGTAGANQKAPVGFRTQPGSRRRKISGANLRRVWAEIPLSRE